MNELKTDLAETLQDISEDMDPDTITLKMLFKSGTVRTWVNLMEQTTGSAK